MNEQDKQIAAQPQQLLNASQYNERPGIVGVEYQHPPAELHIRKVEGGYIIGSSDGVSRHHWHDERRQRVGGNRAAIGRELRAWLDEVDPLPQPKPETPAAAPAQGAK